MSENKALNFFVRSLNDLILSFSVSDFSLWDQVVFVMFHFAKLEDQSRNLFWVTMCFNSMTNEKYSIHF